MTIQNRSTITCTYDVVGQATTTAKGAFVSSGSLHGFAIDNFREGDDGKFSGAVGYKSNCVEAPKGTGAIALGAPVYWNVSGSQVTTTATDILIGFCSTAAASGDDKVQLVFDGKLAFVKANAPSPS